MQLLPEGERITSRPKCSDFPYKVEVLPKLPQGNSTGKLLGLGAPKPSLSGRCFRDTSIAPSEVRVRRAHGAFPTQSK